jgi:pyruvate kinase
MKTKIVATIGPATNNAASLLALAEAGMDVARLNGSHSNLEWHSQTIRLIQRTLPDLPILLDIPGRKIRTLQLKHEPVFSKGDLVTLTTDATHDGTEKVPVSYARLHEDLTVGATILADDGTLRFLVEAIQGPDIICRADCDGQLRSRKGINVPFVTLQGPAVTDKDTAIIKFAQEHDIDFVGISFVDSAEHVRQIRERIGARSPKIVAKVENASGMAHLDEIVEIADAIMVDRGDLSVETRLEDLALFQKRILAAATRHAKPVIIATEMLHTMISNPFPTKAEVSDITNAVLDGASATMLSGETAVGAFPIECVAVMRRIATAAEAYVQSHRVPGVETQVDTVPEATGKAVGFMCRTLPVTKIIAITRTGFAARAISSQHLPQPVLAVSNNASLARSCNLLSGVTGVHVDIPFLDTSLDHIPRCLEELWIRGVLKYDDLILITAVSYPKSGNRMNLLQTHEVGDLVEAFGWKRPDAQQSQPSPAINAGATLVTA